MKIKHLIALFILAAMLTFLGAFAKLESWSFASELMMAGMVVGAIAGLLFIWKLFTTKKFREFLNS